MPQAKTIYPIICIQLYLCHDSLAADTNFRTFPFGKEASPQKKTNSAVKMAAIQQ